MTKKIVSFPHLGNYYIPISYIFNKLTDCEIMVPNPITKKTIELGIKNSPDFVCIPFKYNLGNFIESLERGANVLVQAGGGCRYGYYAEVQEQILKDLGYNFSFFCLTSNDKNIFTHSYSIFKHLNKKLSIARYLYYLLLTFKMIHYMDKLDIYIRSNMGFEVIPNSFNKLRKEMLNEFKVTKNFKHLKSIYKRYWKSFHNIKIDKPRDCLKIGIIGELYTSMEPFSSYYIERSLANMKVEVTRYTDVTYLLITKRFNTKKLLRKCGKYCVYPIGADGMDNIARAKTLAEKGYDGIIHIKPFGCTPEIGAMLILQKISTDYKIPIIYFTFDSHTSFEGINTRLEAFYDMIKMRREHHD
jgi:predicted nucleotide-binding protein (sugar kinase/HSP70/actin superfamily)